MQLAACLAGVVLQNKSVVQYRLLSCIAFILNSAMHQMDADNPDYIAADTPSTQHTPLNALVNTQCAPFTSTSCVPVIVLAGAAMSLLRELAKRDRHSYPTVQR